jgi:4-aminobutyrate aminotransferase/(S)-3-amino-2-methylpropionate transaminase
MRTLLAVAAAAALAVLEKIEREGLLDRARSIGETIMSSFRKMQGEHAIVGDVRGRGAMCAIELVRDPATKEAADDETTSIVKRCLENGVLVLPAGTYNNVVRLLPPITIDERLLGEGLDVLSEAVAAVAA